MREIPENAHEIVTQTIARRREIELHIEMNRDAAAGSLLEVGRWLNAAKDEGVVPHGEWTAWVAEHAALGERTAQLWMQAARELPEGSSLAALGTAKLRSLMALPAGEREEFAQRIGADKLTSREVDAQVKAARAERDEALRLVGEQKKRLAEMDKEKDAAIMDAVNRTRRENREEVDRLNSVIKSDDIGKKRSNKLLDESRAREKSLRDQVTDLSCRLQQAQRTGISPEAAAEIDRLKMTIIDQNIEKKRLEMEAKESLEKEQKLRAEAEKEIDRLSEALDEAQTAAMRGGMAGEGERTNPATMILSAIGALMAQVGRAPAELMRMQGLDEETRQLMAGQARLVGQWAMQILAACGEGDAHA